jgi:hypothetical protein
MSSSKSRVLHSEARKIVASVIQYFYLEKENMGPLIDVKKVLERVSIAWNISYETVKRINSNLRQGDCRGSESSILLYTE